MSRYGLRNLPRNYGQAKALLGKERYERKLANNTVLRRRADGGLAVRHWETDIVVFRKNGAVEVDDGGRCSSTTMARIQACVGYSVFANKGTAYGTYGGLTEELPVVFPPPYTEIRMDCNKLKSNAAWCLLESAGVVYEDGTGSGYWTQDGKFRVQSFRRIGRPVRGRPLYVVSKVHRTDGDDQWREVFRTGDANQLVKFVGDHVGPATASQPSAA